MNRLKGFLLRYRFLVVLVVVTLALTLIPIIDIYIVLGDKWQGVPPTFTDETFYYARVQSIVEGGFVGGHPYFFEHRHDPPLVVFAGAWVNAIPQLLGLPLNSALLVNFILWSLLFVLSLYYLFRELLVPPSLSVFFTLLIYVQSYAHVWRPVNLQPVYPLYFLFYVALLHLICKQNLRNIICLGFAVGATFYFFAYLWQVAVVTLGLLLFYTLARRKWQLLKSTLLSLIIGVVIGLPVLLYALWLSHGSPYFWESVGRLGLVNTHLPMAEVIYSGGWIGLVFVLLVVFYLNARELRNDKNLITINTFIVISGMGLWLMQGSNLVTGKLLETGEHIRTLILPWLVFSTVSFGVLFWRRRTLVSIRTRALLTISIAILFSVSLYYTHYYFRPFLPGNVDHGAWQIEQLYAGPFSWLQNEEKNSVVVWSEPRDYLTTNLPIFTRHFTLYNYFGMLELIPESEIRERYLISQYFNSPALTDFKSEREMELYLGRHDFPHAAKTIERGIKICRLLSFWNKGKDCGIPPTPQSLLGDRFFVDLESQFKNDIVPNIRSYLKKYNVSYILKDKILNPSYRPESLGAVLVYSDSRYEIYRL
ncbi:hypothetical protein IT398_01590 [Candidatus Nomurabacteria bacterium]|nr:hypothetical protein [Candidatus Nomurabacteria bacterium]